MSSGAIGGAAGSSAAGWPPRGLAPPAMGCQSVGLMCVERAELGPRRQRPEVGTDSSESMSAWEVVLGLIPTV